jgi:hypothetical protein
LVLKNFGQVSQTPAQRPGLKTQRRLAELPYKENLTELTALRELREVDQQRISKLGMLLEPLWANKFRQ